MTDHRPHLRLAASTSRPAAKWTAALVTGLLVVGGLLMPTAAANAASGTLPAGSTPASSGPGQLPFDDGRYIVTLRDAPAAIYNGGVKSFAATRAPAGKSLVATSSKVKKYASYLEAQQKDVASDVGAKIVSSYTLATNGFSGKLTGAQATQLSHDARVKTIVKDELLHVQNAVPSTDFLGLSGDNGVWAALGGIKNAGAGVVIADIDTGIAPENLSFAGEPLGTTPGAAPYLDGDATVFNKADGSQFRGECITGVQFTAADCSTKIIGARYFVNNFGIDAIKTVAQGEYLSARDGAGHGSHTASTAAGNNGVTATVAGKDMGKISGVAPAAKLAIYKVCWSSDSGDGCATGDLVAAIDAAVADGVDVINYSIGGGAAETTISLTDQAFLGAASAGIFVSASAGNSGPDASTLDNASPWITTVAASSIPSYDATVTTADGKKFVGGSISLPSTGTISGKLVAAQRVGLAGVSRPDLCGPGTLDPKKVKGTVVLCIRGTVDRVAKSAEVLRAGGIGMILANPAEDSIDLDTHSVPTIHLNGDSFAAINAYAATTGASVTFEDGNTSDQPSVPTPQVAGFSSRGPVLADGGDLLKPDIAAPGVAILADGPNAAGKPGTYEFMSGTSMSAPHITGLAALYLSKRPNATPSEIKSAMMTTAYNTVDQNGDDSEDVFAQGAGQIDPTKFFEPGLLYLTGVDDWKGYLQSFGQQDYGVKTLTGTELNLASISIGELAGEEKVTRTVTSTEAGTFTAEPVTIPGVTVSVSPSTLSFDKAGETAEYTVSFARTDAALDEFATGYLRWKSGTTVVTDPIAVRPISLSAPADVQGSGNSGSTVIPVQAGETADVAIAATGLTKGQVVRGTGKVGGAPANFVVRVPAGTSLARYELNADDDTADLDMNIYRSSPFGETVLRNSAETGNADERIDVADPDESTYIVSVSFFSGEGNLDFTLTTFLVNDNTMTGHLGTTPETLPMTLGQPAAVTANWSGLKSGGSYLGKLSYGDTGRTTYVTIAGDKLTETLPAVGEMTATADPGFVRKARETFLTASGLVPGEKYDVFLDDSTSPIADGFADDEGKLDRFFNVGQQTAYGDHVLTVKTLEGSASTPIVVSRIVLNYIFPIINAAFDGTPVVEMDALFAGTGSIRTLVESDAGTPVYDETVDVDADPMFDLNESISPKLALAAGEFHAKAWAVAADGTQTQLHETTFTVTNNAPSYLTLTKNAEDAGSVDLEFANNTFGPLYPDVAYKTCAGPMVYANIGMNQDALVNSTFNLAGITDMTMSLDGKVIGSFSNTSASKCASKYTIDQPLWITMSDKGATGTSGAPISAVVSNRYATYSYGYDLRMGTGTEVLQNQLSFEGIPVDYTTTEGPVIDRTFDLKENQPYWIAAVFERFTPGKQSMNIRRALTPAVTLNMLQPVVQAKKLKVSAASGLLVAGSKTTVVASGLAAREKYTIKVAGRTVLTGTASAAGGVRKSVTIPKATAAGKRSVQVFGSIKTRTGSDTISVIKKSKTLKVTLSPKSTVEANRTLTIKVSGLGSKEHVKVTFNGKRVSASTAKASSSGVYTVKVSAGYSWGKKLVKVTGQVSTRSGKSSITVVRRTSAF